MWTMVSLGPVQTKQRAEFDNLHLKVRDMIDLINRILTSSLIDLQTFMVKNLTYWKVLVSVYEKEDLAQSKANWVLPSEHFH